MTSILLAVPDLADEAELVAAAPSCGLRVTRRCVDAVDLFAAAAAYTGSAVVVSAGLPRLGSDVVERITAGGHRPVVGLAADAESAERLRALGIRDVVTAGSTAQASLRALRAAVDAAASQADVPADDAEPSQPDAMTDQPPGTGSIVAVWGPVGAPGRTTVAIGVAEALAEQVGPTCLVDADTYGPAVALALGVVEDASGLLVACRHADSGRLAPTTLRALAPSLGGGLHLLSGLPAAERWADLRARALDAVWQACRDAFVVTVVDVGFCLEDDDVDAWSRHRNAAARTALAAANHVVAVGECSPLGAVRLAAAWPALAAAAPRALVAVLANRARRGQQRQWSSAVAGLGVDAAIRAVPDDPRAVGRAWANGRTLGDVAPRSAVRRALQESAADIVSG